MIDFRTANVTEFLNHYQWEASPDELMKKLVRKLVGKLENPAIPTKQKLKISSSLRSISPVPEYAKMSSSQSSFLVAHINGTYTIFLNSSHSEGRQLYSWAHEICHTFFPVGKNEKRIDSYWTTGENPEVEYLCELGAGELLFCGVKCKSLPYNIQTLKSLSGSLNTSLEATAIFMAKSLFWPGKGMAVWEKKLKKGENPNQTSFFLEIKQYPVFRIEYAIYPNGPFLPKMKSVNKGDILKLTDEKNKSLTGKISLNLKQPVELRVETLKLYGDKVLTLVKGHRNEEFSSRKPKGQ